MLAFFIYLFLSGEFLSHIPFWFYFSVASFSYTSHACFVILWGVSLTHSMLASFFFSFLVWGVSLTHPVLASFLSGEFLLHISCLLFFCGEFLLSLSLRTDSFLFGEFLSHIPCWLLFMWGVSCTQTMLASLCGEFLLHIWCWLLYVEVFSYMSHAGLFMLGVYLTHPVLAA